MRQKNVLRCFIALGALVAGGPAALAQRADENAYAAAEDAFGTRVGSEGLGLYDSRNARGFDPTQAGNIRLEGLYYDQQATFGGRLNRSTTMHVGISAQSYPLPAPTGIADLSLVLPGERRVLSFQITHQDHGSANQHSVDISTPLTPTLGLVGGVVFSPNTNEYGGDNYNAATGLLLRWRPNDNLEIIPFAAYNKGIDIWVAPQIFTGGDYLPPAFHRRRFFGQPWANRKFDDYTFGTIVRGALFEGWRLQAGFFRSDDQRPTSHSIFYRNTQPDGTASLEILAFPRQRSSSFSGETRASGVYTQGSYRHTVHVSLRGRDVVRLFNGASSASFGTANIGVFQPQIEPTYTFGPRDKDTVRQLTPGASYFGQWAGVGEFSVGVQKSFYRRRFGRETSTTPLTTTSQPWLYNATLSLTPTRELAFYGSYTRGLEEFGTAPDNAANRGQPMPADITEQFDAGARYRIMQGLSFMAGLFEVKKPYFDRDLTNVYTRVGARSHKGIEMSLTGQLAPGLTVVAGAVLVKARVSGVNVTSGQIGRIPFGVPAAVYTASLQYGPAAWKGFAVDLQAKSTASEYTNRTNTFRIPASTTADVGMRYNFKAFGSDASLRFQLLNITDAYAWKIDAVSGSLYPTAMRRYYLRLAADF